MIDMAWGGRRKGAGRPPAGEGEKQNVKLQLHLTEQEAGELNEVSSREGVTPAAWARARLVEAVRQALGLK